MRAPLSWFTDVLRQGDPAWSATAEEVDAFFAPLPVELELPIEAWIAPGA